MQMYRVVPITKRRNECGFCFEDRYTIKTFVGPNGWSYFNCIFQSGQSQSLEIPASRSIQPSDILEAMRRYNAFVGPFASELVGITRSESNRV